VRFDEEANRRIAGAGFAGRKLESSYRVPFKSALRFFALMLF
jgi:hypothetical protein